MTKLAAIEKLPTPHTRDVDNVIYLRTGKCAGTGLGEETMFERIDFVSLGHSPDKLVKSVQVIVEAIYIFFVRKLTVSCSYIAGPLESATTST